MRQLEECPVCCSRSIRFDYSAPTTRTYLDSRLWSVWQCTSCTHGFMNPQPSWEELTPYYSAEYDPYDPSSGSTENDEATIERARNKGTLRHIPLPLKSKRLLDVGCGGGFFPRIAKKLGATVEGLEPSRHGAEQARKSGIKVFNGTLEQFLAGGNSGPFDIITANHVVEHVSSPVMTLSLMRRLLAPGGYIWIAVPNGGYSIARKLGGNWVSTDLPYHLMQFTPDSIRLAGTLAGLEVRRQVTESVPQFVAGSLRLYLRYRWKIPRRLTNHLGLIDSVWAPRFAKRMDAERSGEAILTEFVSS